MRKTQRRISTRLERERGGIPISAQQTARGRCSAAGSAQWGEGASRACEAESQDSSGLVRPEEGSSGPGGPNNRSDCRVCASVGVTARSHQCGRRTGLGGGVRQCSRRPHGKFLAPAEWETDRKRPPPSCRESGAWPLPTFRATAYQILPGPHESLPARTGRDSSNGSLTLGTATVADINAESRGIVTLVQWNAPLRGHRTVESPSMVRVRTLSRSPSHWSQDDADDPITADPGPITGRPNPARRRTGSAVSFERPGQ